jgi:(1->4)-alpha-D-glucan 1-alpha-D-glucosylmutase
VPDHPDQFLATYRLQLTESFGFDEAAALAPYLRRLGVSHVYLSPILQAGPGSTHGYDVADHRRLSEELGGMPAYRRMCTAFGAEGLGQVVDVVPNHMAAIAENPWWWDVLENGPSSPYADHFDIDWDPPGARLPNAILVPVLGDHYGRVLDAGEIHVEREGGSFVVRYFEHRFPLAPRSWDVVLHDAAERAGSDVLGFFADACANLPASWRTDLVGVNRRHRDKEALSELLLATITAHPELRTAIDAALVSLNGDIARLDSLLDRQNYRLAFWRTGAFELDYRRFFDVTGLAGLRVDDEKVFDATHALLLELVEQGCIDGLRIDHPDGLRDPAGYLERLRSVAPHSWIVVEKILAHGEALRDWPIDGTTGYEYLNIVQGMFVDPAGEAPLDALRAELTGDDRSFAEVELEAKRQILRQILPSDLARLTNVFLEVCETERSWRDYPTAALRRALEEMVISFGIYRTYVRERPRSGAAEVAPADEAAVDAAVAVAQARVGGGEDLFAFLRDVLLLRRGGPAGADLASRFQQLTAPVMAKGVEDTAGYRYLRLGALSEVGGHPGRFGGTVAEFHQHNRAMAERWPRTMLSSSTHDTKRSEDVRARIVVLSEMAGQWADTVRAWRDRNARHRRSGTAPDGLSEHLIYETLVAAHPLPEERLRDYLQKAMREAKLSTSWLDPSARYEEDTFAFVSALYADDEFMAAVAEFTEPLIRPGRLVSVAQTLCKLTSPGVPDTYQGTELFDDSLVDPDNRRPVDHDLRRTALDTLDRLAGGEPGWAGRLWDAPDAAGGLAKLHTVRTALAVRRARPDAFGPGGSYVPLAPSGPAADHVVAFGRGDEVLTVVPCRALRFDPAGDAARATTVPLPAGRWVDELSGVTHDGGEVAVDALLGSFGVALLTRDNGRNDHR